MPENENEIDPRRLFRREIMVSAAELRLDVGRQLVRNVLGNETVTLANKEVSVLGNETITQANFKEIGKSGKGGGSVAIKRGGRERTVEGNYARTISHDDTYLVGASITETAKTGVISKMKFESESIVGGTYINTMAGATLKTCAWSDFLCWGGWLEADVTRIEITGVAIRSYAIYNHAAGARIVICDRSVEDYQVRNETIGVLIDSTTAVVDAGPPGSGVTLEN